MLGKLVVEARVSTMNGIDWNILAEPEGDARLPFAELSERVGLSKSRCWSRVRDLEADGIVAGFYASTDPGALGLAMQCRVAVRIRCDGNANFEAVAIDHPAAIEGRTAAGESHYLLRLYDRLVEHLDEAA